MRIAIIHDWLETYAGSERVTEQLLSMFPSADLFALVDFLPPGQRQFLQGHKPRTSFIQRMPFARRRFRSYLPLFPFAIQQMDLSGYDLVISCSHAVAKGVITGPNQLHVSYVHSPIRYAWDLQGEYLRTAGLKQGVKSWLVRAALHRIRQWDIASSHGVDSFVANSRFVARRIAKAYGRRAAVVWPPVDTQAFTRSGDRENYYLVMARQVPYKRVDLLVQAFGAMPQRRLVVIGDGPEATKIRGMAADNVTILGPQPFAVVREHMRRARAFVYAAIEDFGIVLAEAQAAGMPVIALRHGGAEDIVLDLTSRMPTGVLFDEQTPNAITAAIERFEANAHRIDWRDCCANAERFSIAAFRATMRRRIDDAIATHRDVGLRCELSTPAGAPKDCLELGHTTTSGGGLRARDQVSTSLHEAGQVIEHASATAWLAHPSSGDD
jgi:glycosyltransferase involved in cell wall biosynthesis